MKTPYSREIFLREDFLKLCGWNLNDALVLHDLLDSMETAKDFAEMDEEDLPPDDKLYPFQRSISQIRAGCIDLIDEASVRDSVARIESSGLLLIDKSPEDEGKDAVYTLLCPEIRVRISAEWKARKAAENIQHWL